MGKPTPGNDVDVVSDDGVRLGPGRGGQHRARDRARAAGRPDAGLLARRRRERRGLPRRLVLHGRPRGQGRGRLLLVRQPLRRRDHLGLVPDRAVRGGVGAGRAPGGGGIGRRRQARSRAHEHRQGVRRARAGPRGLGRARARAAGSRQVRDRALQVPARDRVRRARCRRRSRARSAAASCASARDGASALRDRALLRGARVRGPVPAVRLGRRAALAARAARLRRRRDARRSGTTSCSATPRRSALRRCAARSPGLYEHARGRRRDRQWSGPARRSSSSSRRSSRPGDHVVALWPAYQSLYDLARAQGAEVELVELRPEDGWALDLDRIAAAMRPSDARDRRQPAAQPDGHAADAESELDALVELVERHGATLVCDEVYRGLEHDPARPPAGRGRPLAERRQRRCALEELRARGSARRLARHARPRAARRPPRRCATTRRSAARRPPRCSG